MKAIVGVLVVGGVFSWAVAQPPRKEEEDPKAKTGRAIDIESFPATKSATKAKAPEGPGATLGSGTLVVGVRELPTLLSPRLARTDPEVWATDLIFDRLLRPRNTSDGTTWEPSLAVGMTAEPNARTFQLDPKAKWADGSPVVANDVLATLERRRGPLGEATSDAARRITIGLRLPVPDSASLFAFPVLPASRPDDDAFARSPLGSGPFAYAGPTTQGGRQYAVYPQQPHASTRSRPPMLREVRYLAGPEPIDDLRRGLADVVLETRGPAIFGGTKLPADVRVVIVPSRRIYFLAINPLKNAFAGDSGRAMRRAVGFGIRREVILDEVWRVADPRTHHALTGPFPAGSWPVDAETGPLDDDSLARAELKVGTPPTEKLTLIYDEADPAHAPACSRIAAQLAGLGLPCEARGLVAAEYRRAVAEKQYDLAYSHFDYADDWFDPTELFQKAGSSQRLDAALGRATVRAEFAARRDAYRRVHRDFRTDMPFVPLWNLDVFVVLRRGVEPWPAADRLDPLHPLMDIDRWRVTR